MHVHDSLLEEQVRRARSDDGRLQAYKGYRGRLFQGPTNMEDLDINLFPDMK